MNIPKIIACLRHYGITATGLSSELDQKKRIRLLRDFKAGKYKYLIATDVASRGIDIENIDVVYNYDLPQDSENYVHRIGRTARAGRKGRSIALCSESDYTELERIERYLNSKLPMGEINEDYLVFPKGHFTPAFPDEAIPGEKKFQGRDKNDSRRKPQRGRERDKNRDRPKHDHPPAKMSHTNEHHQQHPSHQSPKPHQPGQKKDRPKPEDVRINRKHTEKHHQPKASFKNDSRRNLFDKDATNKAPSKKQSVWNKIFSLFKKD